MKILLISPPTSSIVKEVLGSVGPPLGLAYLASVARELGCEVRIIDALSEDLSLRDIEKVVKKFYPDLVGITATTSMILDAYNVAETVKNVNPDTVVLMGGPHVTFMASETLRECPHIDIIVRGEGELTFKEIILSLLKGQLKIRDVAGITYRVDDEIRENPPRPLIPNLDEIPIPAYDLLPMERYRFGKIKFGAIITSRGCPYNCVFCSSSLQFGKKWRAHGVKRVLEELHILRYEYDRREIEFLDDTFTLNRKRAREIARGMVADGLDVTWSASSRVNTFDQETGRLMQRAGAHTVYFGIESGSEKTLKFIGKGITKSQAKDAVKAAKKAGLRALGSFVIGFPYETEDDIKATIRFSNEVGVDLAQFTVATPYPGTRLWDIAVKENLLLTRNWRKFTTVDVVMRNIYLAPEKIKKLFLWAYLKFYLHPRHALEDLVRNRGFVLRKTIPAAIRFLKKSLLSVIKGEQIWLKPRKI